MKKILTILLAAFLCADAAMAQPAARRREQAQQQQQQDQGLSVRAQISFPTQKAMDEDVTWRRDLYREISLTDDANAGLYYPVEPVGSQMNLFTYIFKLVLRRAIPAYEYRLDGSEVFDEASKINLKAFLDNYHIFYERTNRGIRIDDSDIPSREVTAYYVKESAYFDDRNSAFHTKVLALCPILKRDDDFGDGGTSYPLFWVKYDDLAPFLTKQTIMTSNLNNAAVMSMDDFFTKNMYKGKIYKTTNMLGKTLAQYCPTDSAMAKEQKRIEKQLVDFEQNIWGKPEPKDSLDSIARVDKKAAKALAKKNRRAGGSASAQKTSRTRVKKSRSHGSSSPASSGSARVTVRRQRH